MERDELRMLTDALLEQLPLGVILTDPQGNMVLVNQTAERIRHIERQKMLGRNVLDCHGAKSRPNVQRAVETSCKTRRPCISAWWTIRAMGVSTSTPMRGW